MAEDDAYCENSEMRFLVIELMKLAARKGTSFDFELAEFIDNAYKLREALFDEHEVSQEELSAGLARMLQKSPGAFAKERR
jgi:hypothetical protein